MPVTLEGHIPIRLRSLTGDAKNGTWDHPRTKRVLCCRSGEASDGTCLLDVNSSLTFLRAQRHVKTKLVTPRLLTVGDSDTPGVSHFAPFIEVYHCFFEAGEIEM